MIEVRPVTPEELVEVKKWDSLAVDSDMVILLHGTIIATVDTFGIVSLAPVADMGRGNQRNRAIIEDGLEVLFSITPKVKR